MASPNISQLKSDPEKARAYLEEIRINKKNEPLVVASVGKYLIESSNLRDTDSMFLIINCLSCLNNTVLTLRMDYFGTSLCSCT